MRLIATLGMLALTACASPARETPAAIEPAPTGTSAQLNCAAESVQYAVGQTTSAVLGSKLVKESGSRNLRWMPPRSAATMDYRQDRLNIAYDDNMIITRINCG